MSLVIVDYGIGNVLSIANILRTASVAATISAEPGAIRGASRLILAGVGAFDVGMTNLHACGLVPVLREAVFEKHIPLLGICLGMQLLMEGSEEGSCEGLGWIKGRSVRLRSEGAIPLKVPHMGWNSIERLQDTPLLDDLDENTRFYFAHSYAVECTHKNDVVADAFHGKAFPAIVTHGRVCGVQFHPEKSHRYGRQLLKNFASADLNEC